MYVVLYIYIYIYRLNLYNGDLYNTFTAFPLGITHYLECYIVFLDFTRTS